MPDVNVRIRNISPNSLPEYATPGSSGVDVSAFLPNSLTLKPGERALVPTGLFVEIPEGYEIQVRPRSGLAIKQGLTLLNSPGTIDSDYRGEIKIILINLSAEDQVIKPGDRIAQLVVQQVDRITWVESQLLSETGRASGGFGHTGK